jgi:hypothetical protein
LLLALNALVVARLFLVYAFVVARPFLVSAIGARWRRKTFKCSFEADPCANRLLAWRPRLPDVEARATIRRHACANNCTENIFLLAWPYPIDTCHRGADTIGYDEVSQLREAIAAHP